MNSKAARLEAIREFAEFLQSKSGKQRFIFKEENTGQYEIETRFGKAVTGLDSKHGWFLWLQFEEPDRAWKGLYGDAPRSWSRDLNPHSGKMNLHANPDHPAAEFIKAAKLWIERVLRTEEISA